MELLGEFFEKDVDGSLSSEKEICYKLRKAARAVLFGRDGEIAMMFVSKNNYHKLPGGGVEKNENMEAALKREVLEEVGCDIRIRPQSLGAIIEYRDTHQLLQISYCYVADAATESVAVNLTDEEKERDLRLEWMSLDDAIEVLEKAAPVDYVGEFIVKRDLLFLQKAKELIKI